MVPTETCQYCGEIVWTNGRLPYCLAEQNIPDWASKPKECPAYCPYIQAIHPKTGLYVKIDLESGTIVDHGKPDKIFPNLRIVKGSVHAALKS